MIDKNKPSAAPIVAIFMGSKSDLRVMSQAVSIMEKCQVPYEIKVISAHRTPDRMVDYAKNAKKRSIEVIIAGAGGAAHLPGMVSALTILPVIGVPVKLAELDGLDSLLSIVQMPKGVPVATVGINNARNAGILAARILAIKYPEIRTKLESYVISEKEKAGYDLDDDLKEYLEAAEKT